MRFSIIIGFFMHAYLTRPDLHAYEYSTTASLFFGILPGMLLLWDILEAIYKGKSG